MRIYRYSDESSKKVALKASKSSIILTAIAFGIPLGVFAINSNWQPATIYALLITSLFGSCVLWWQSRSAFKKALDTVRSTEVELTETQLDIRHPVCPVSIRREDVIRIRYLSSGLFVQTKNFTRSAQLGRELDGFNELAQR